MPDKKLTEELLNELLDAPSIEGYIKIASKMLV